MNDLIMMIFLGLSALGAATFIIVLGSLFVIVSEKEKNDI